MLSNMKRKQATYFWFGKSELAPQFSARLEEITWSMFSVFSLFILQPWLPPPSQPAVTVLRVVKVVWMLLRRAELELLLLSWSQLDPREGLLPTRILSHPLPQSANHPSGQRGDHSGPCEDRVTWSQTPICHSLCSLESALATQGLLWFYCSHPAFSPPRPDWRNISFVLTQILHLDHCNPHFF